MQRYPDIGRSSLHFHRHVLHNFGPEFLLIPLHLIHSWHPHFHQVRTDANVDFPGQRGLPLNRIKGAVCHEKAALYAALYMEHMIKWMDY